MKKIFCISLFSSLILSQPIHADNFLSNLISSEKAPVPLEVLEKEKFIRDQIQLEKEIKDRAKRKRREIASIIKGRWLGKTERWDIERAFLFNSYGEKVYLVKFGYTDDWINFIGNDEVISFSWSDNEGELQYKRHKKLMTCKLKFDFLYAGDQTTDLNEKVWIMDINCGKKTYYLFKQTKTFQGFFNKIYPKE